MPAFRLVVSSPPPSEPDLRLPPHPALHEHIERLSTRAASLVVKYTPPSGSAAPVFTGDLLPASKAACSLDPFALWTAFPSSVVGRYSHDYYGSSATSRRQQRTVRLPQTQSSGSAGTAGTLPTFTHMPVGRVGAQLYPGDIAARYRNTARGLTHPSDKRTGETVLSKKQDRASRQPIAASFGAAVLYRGFYHWFGFPTPFCLASAPGPLAADRCYVVGAAPTLRLTSSIRLPPASPGRYGDRRWAFPPTRLIGASWRRPAMDDEEARVLPAG